MIAVLISIRPKWCEKIISGEKTIEVRKTRPKLIPQFKCYIYCTLPKYPHEDFIATDYPRPQFYGGGKVIGEFTCNRIRKWCAWIIRLAHLRFARLRSPARSVGVYRPAADEIRLGASANHPPAAELAVCGGRDMERLTSPNINVDPDTDRFLHAAIGGKKIDWKQSRDSTLNVLINGPTSNGFGKDIFRKMARDLYGRLKAYEDTGWTPEMLRKLGENAWHLWDFAQAAENMTVGRLKEFAEADKDGRVVVLPCKVGDKLYRVFAGEIFEHRVGSMKYFAIQGRWDIETYPFCPCVESSIGKTVFFSREEAEKALQEME